MLKCVESTTSIFCKMAEFDELFRDSDDEYLSDGEEEMFSYSVEHDMHQGDLGNSNEVILLAMFDENGQQLECPNLPLGPASSTEPEQVVPPLASSPPSPPEVVVVVERLDGDVYLFADEHELFHEEVAASSRGGAARGVRIGIIGGSGFDDPSLFQNPIELHVNTPFGKPSDTLLQGQIKGVPCVLLARHGRKHQYQPSDVNYRANIWALKEAGCTHVLATTATGSLVEEYKPGDLVILDDFIDRTWGRKCTFYDRTEGGPRGVCHLPMRPAFCERSRRALFDAAVSRGYRCHEKGTAVVIQGPRFSSRAESLMHRQWGGHLVNMTTVPEVVLAKEAGLSYAAVALITDYDCWREDEKSVSVSEVLAMFAQNVKKAADVILDAVQILGADPDLEYLNAHRELVTSSIMLKD